MFWCVQMRCGLYVACARITQASIRHACVVHVPLGRRALKDVPTAGGVKLLQRSVMARVMGATHAIVQACYDAARSADPKLAAVWEAMAAFEATRSPEATLDTVAGAETHGLAKHALHLGGGVEASLTFAYGALQSGSAPSNGVIQGAARGAVVTQPLNAAAYHTLALAMEASGAPAAACAALRAARALHTAATAAPAAVVPGAPLVAATWRGFSVDECMSLDLARVLVAAGEWEEACGLYEGLDSKERPVTNTYALLSYALAKGGGKKLHAGLLQRAMDGAMAAEEVADVAAAAVTAATSSGGGCAAAAAAAQWSAPRLQEWGDGGTGARAAARGAAAARLGVLVAAAAGGSVEEYAAARAAAVSVAYRMHAPADEHTDVADRDVLQQAAADIEVCAAVHARDACVARRAATRAVHLCPWSATHRDIAVCVSASDSAAPVHAARLAPRNRSSPGPQHDDGLATAAVDAVAEVHLRHAGLPALCSSAGSGAPDVADGIRAAKAAVMRDPRRVRAYVSLGAALSQRAVLSGGYGASSAVRACMHATRMLSAADEVGGGSSTATLRVHALLACAIAESTAAADEACSGCDTGDVGGEGERGHSERRMGGQGGQATAGAALEAAQNALHEAEACSAGVALKAGCLRQVARCQRLLGNSAAAEAALRHGADLGDAACGILLARLLISEGRGAEVVAPEGDAGGECVEWLQARKVAAVEAACAVGDLERAKAAAGGVDPASRAAPVANALVAVGALEQMGGVEGRDLGGAVKVQLSQVRRFGQLALAGCDRADVAVVAALALAESERRRAKPDAQWVRVATEAAEKLAGVAMGRDGGRAAVVRLARHAAR